jgi:hypothetical protein
MKIFGFMCAMVFAAQVHAGSASIVSLSQQLAQVMNGEFIIQLTPGQPAKSLIEQKYLKEQKLDKLDADFHFSADVTSIEESDGSGVGTATEEAASDLAADLVVNFLGYENGVALPKATLDKKIEKVESLVKRLGQAGAKFGFDANGSGVCGVNYTTLLVIDVEAGAIHEFSAVSGPC